MNKVAVIVAPGFEEGETVTIVDVLRRVNIECCTFGFEKVVRGGHGIKIECDECLNDSLMGYDMVVLPGGYGGVEAMKGNEYLLSMLKQMNEKRKYICAMCAAPAVLEKIDLLVGKNYTAYKGYDQKIKQGHYLEDIVVVDGNIVTGRGPATVYPFAFQLAEILGKKTSELKERLMYNELIRK